MEGRSLAAAMVVSALCSTLRAGQLTPQTSLNETGDAAVQMGTAARAVVSWRGTAGDGLWSNPANWDPGAVPGPSDIARFDALSPDARFDSAPSGVLLGLTLEDG